MTLLVRPYAVDRLDLARTALSDAIAGDWTALRTLYVRSRDELAALDPDEIRESTRAHPEAASGDRAALRAAEGLADTWEGVVAVAGTLENLPRFRAFLMTCATLRYLDVDDPDLGTFQDWCRGAWLPDLSPEDSVLYAALPALLGLGPDLPQELPEPAPADGEPLWSLLGLPEADWDGLDPLDGRVLSPAACTEALDAAEGAWKTALLLGSTTGLLIRAD